MRPQTRFSLICLFVLSIATSAYPQDASLNKLLEQSKSNRVGVSYGSNVDNALRKDELKKIKDVFGDRTNDLILSNPNYLKDIKNLLRNRIRIFEIKDVSKQKKTKLLSQVPLNTTYNPDLSRDLEFKLESFNPLKYQFDFFSKGTYLYQIDDTNYFIQISSQYRR